MNTSQKSFLEVTIELMKNRKKPQKAIDLIKETLEMKGQDDNDGQIAAQLYTDMTSSALFVYCGEGLWDLKTRQELSLWDKDGSFFSKGIVEEEEEIEVTADDYELAPSEEEVAAQAEDEEDDDFEIVSTDDDDEVTDEYEGLTYVDYDEDEAITEKFYDEDKYNDYMDDYEDLYDN